LETTCTRFNTSARRRTRPSAVPESRQLLQILPSLTVRQFFSVSAYFFLLRQHWRVPIFSGRLVFSMRQYFSMRQCFCMRQYFTMRQCFVCAKVLACANVFVHFLWRLYFCVFYLHSYLVCANNLLAQMFQGF
jgi:hypothetical protein